MTATSPDAELARLDALISALTTEIIDIEHEADRARKAHKRLLLDLNERIEGKKAERDEAMSRIDALIEEGGLS